MSRQGMTQDELARRVGATQPSIYKILNGKTLKPRNLPDIAAALGLTTEELLGDPPGEDGNLSPAHLRLQRKIEEASGEDLKAIEEIIDAILGLRKAKSKHGVE